MVTIIFFFFWNNKSNSLNPFFFSLREDCLLLLKIWTLFNVISKNVLIEFCFFDHVNLNTHIDFLSLKVQRSLDIYLFIKIYIILFD